MLTGTSKVVRTWVEAPLLPPYPQGATETGGVIRGHGVIFFPSFSLSVFHRSLSTPRSLRSCKHRMAMATLTSAMAAASTTSCTAATSATKSLKNNAPSLQTSFLSGPSTLRRVTSTSTLVRVSNRKQTLVVAMARKPPVVVEEDKSDERFRLSNLSPQPGSRHRQKRKGRGIAAGQGASCGFGMRGQKSRSGSGVRPGFEGGQMPLYRRLPKLRGIAGGMGAGLPKYVSINLTEIAAAFEAGEEVSLEALKERRILNPSGRDRKLPLKILGDGELDFKVTIKAGAISAAAKEKLDSLGCECTILPKRKKWVSAAVSKNQARADAYFAKKRGESSA